MTFSVDEWLKTIEMKRFVEHGMFLQMKTTPIICHKKNTSTTGTIGGSISISRAMTPNHWETFWFQTSVVYIEAFSPRSWRGTNRTRSLLEVQTMEIGIEFFLYLVVMARFLVVFVRIQRKSRKKRQAKACDWSGQHVIYRTLSKTSEEWLPRIHPILLQIDRLQLTAVYCNRRCKDNTSNDPFSRCEICKNLGYSLSWRWQDKVGLQHP